jgi:chorismate-pyruvate lyase
MPELEPLAAFHPLPPIDYIAAAAIPAPYRPLLDHQQDMTSTLEAFHKGRVDLRVLQSHRNGRHYLREVLLVIEDTRTPVEYGAIRIALAAFNLEGQHLILEGRRPLGAILAKCGISYISRPKTFIRVEADETMQRALGLADGQVLFGRCNQLSDAEGRELADIVEILPPLGKVDSHWGVA